MKSKKIICGVVAAAITVSVAFSGCGLLTTINEEDMKQTVATVNIAKSDKLGDDLKQYASALQDEVILKRDLVNAFINVGSNYVNSGMSYEATFNSLMSELANNAVVIQYATVYLLANKDGVTLSEYSAKTEMKDKLIYLLGGEQSKGVLKAQYNLYSSLNSTLDGYEDTDDDDEDEYEGTDTRSTPTGIDTAVEDYLPLKDDGKALDYGVYTGYEGYLLSDAGKYEGKDKTNRNTRRQAYSRFLKSIENNYLLTSEDKDVTDVLKLSYVQSQYVSQLQQSVVDEFNDLYTKEQEAKISMVVDSEYAFVREAYDNLLQEQSQTNSKASAFESAMGSASDTSFILYSPSTTNDTEQGVNGSYGTYGYVYNILLPFSVTQSNRLSKLQGYRDSDLIDEGGYFEARNELMKNILTTDQRAAWFNGSTDYSFDAAKYNEDKQESEKLSYYDAGNSDRKYLFFENNLTKPKEYEKLEKYTGKYTYNGKVTPNKDGSYTLVPNKLDIDGMLEEFSAYINYVLGRNAVSLTAGDKLPETNDTNFNAYYDVKAKDFYDKDDEKKIDYSKLVYATGRVNFDKTEETNTSNTDMFTEKSERYKVTSAVNELQYAYTTDTGVLSQYIGYSVSAYETTYIKEFEYAAQQALRLGAGAFKVCAGDYGWHLIYVTDAFDFNGGEVYSPEFTKDRVEEEGTFENKFYEWIKDKTLSNEITQKRTEILQYFSTDTTVIKFEKAYKDLLRLG